jgi:hypothetical protein
MQLPPYQKITYKNNHGIGIAIVTFYPVNTKK